MQSTLKRLAAVAALGTVGILAPAGGASAAVTPATAATFAFPSAGFPALGLGLPAGAGVGHVTTVVGPTIIVSTPSTFINTNNQVSPATP
jgi:hypothetical protein